jgi:uncharacterized membrane protein (UPF0182 family)
VATSAGQRLVGTPNEPVKDTPYIAYNIAATRAAFGLDAVEERQLSGDAMLTRGDIARNRATIANVRLWDRQPLLDTFGQIQEIRTYYDFVSIDIDRYLIDGQYRQVMLSARELNSDALPNKSWINERLTFTHGYGLALGPVNEVTPEGLPVLFVKNLPPESSVVLDIREPSIYYGELSSAHVFVHTKAREFHYPRGDDNVYQNYRGTGGVPIGNGWRELLLAVRFRSFKILLSDDLTPTSRVLFHRNILDRASTIAPFLRFDRDPYLVVADGRLFWMLDAYTTTDRYPYATPAEAGINYIRNSVKVVIDAYNGTVTFYLADPADPIAATLAKIFPDVFRPLSRMPASLRRHVRYPESLFAVQSGMFATYHMTNPAVFYNKEDQWEVPAIESGRTAVPMEPYYTIMRLPGAADAEFIQMLPFTPRRKDNLAAWMVARSDGDHYGKLLVFQFPKQKVVFGPRQVVARINQDQEISPQITLWNQQGSEVIQGTLLVIPIEESLLYVRPLYLRAAGGKIPELKRVIVAYQNRIVMDDTLDKALERVFRPGAGAEATAGLAPLAPDESAEQAATEETAPVGSLAELAAQHALPDVHDPHHARRCEQHGAADGGHGGAGRDADALGVPQRLVDALLRPAQRVGHQRPGRRPGGDDQRSAGLDRLARRDDLRLAQRRLQRRLLRRSREVEPDQRPERPEPALSLGLQLSTAERGIRWHRRPNRRPTADCWPCSSSWRPWRWAS